MDKKIIIISGNDGTGKTSLTKSFNSDNNTDYLMIERSTPNECVDITNEQIKLLDNLTLQYTWNRTNTDYPKITDQIYRFLLDLDPSTINKRIANRDDPITPWDTPKAIKYYNNRFRELGYYYGIPLIDCESKSHEQIKNQIINCIESGLYNEIKYLKLETITHEFIKSHNIENYLIQNFDKYFAQYTNLYRNYVSDDFELTGLFKFDDYAMSCFDDRIDLIEKKIWVRWFLSNSINKYVENRTKYSLCYLDIQVILNLDTPILIPYIQGESKKIYKIISKFDYFDNQVLITLKPTIYSHSKQATGEIKDLEKIRAQGTMIFMEMLARNDITHSYLSINSDGIILSRLANTNQLEVVFKRYCEGTDKHSYYNIRNVKQIVLDSGEYTNSLYIRFDWRNPNHTLNGLNVTDSPYYYLIEEYEGKETFFTKYLSKSNILGIIPYGDKTISSDILEQMVDVPKIKESVIKIYSTIESYLNKIGIEAKDGCFMIDSEGKYFWSEINQDCMRLKTLDSSKSYDKDIWRIGGSSQSNSVTNKWIELNQLMMNYFETNKFYKHEMMNTNKYNYFDTLERFLSNSKYSISNEYKNIYLKLLNKYTENKQKRVLLTLDMYGTKPVLVKKGKVYQSHTDDVDKAFDKISLYPDILMVDLDGAIDKNKTVNREIIKHYGIKNYIHTGGGIHTLSDVQELLEASVRRIVISSNTNDEFISQIPKERLIVELSVNDKFEVLIDGRKTNTHIHIKDKLIGLGNLGVNAISITFQETEGMCQGIPKSMINDLVQYIPKNISKVFIAGGITTIEDLKFIWSYPKFIPQLGSAIWKNLITMGELYCAMAKWDENNLINCVIQNKNGIVLGVIYMDKEALELTCQNKLLYRYSRQFKKIMCKGDISGNYQKVIKMSFDCDNDSLLVVVEDSKPFCHTSNQSCFSNQTVIKANMNIINEHIANCNETNSKYVSKLKKYPGFNLLKINEEFWEILSNPNIHECSDFLIHFIIYLNSIGISWDGILNELNARRWNPKLLKSRQEKNNLGTLNVKDNQNIITTTTTTTITTTTVPDEKCLFIGITGTKYQNKTNTFMETELGIKLAQLTGRNLEIKYDIVDQFKYAKYFKDYKVYFVNMRPKDMPYMVSSGTIDGTITYNSVIENQPDIFNPLIEITDPDIELALIRKKSDQELDTNLWTLTSKCYIACEHQVHVYNYLTKQLGLNDNVFSTVHILGSSESFLVNKSKINYTLADAIVESGSTLKENNLEIWKTIVPKGELKIGLYINKMFNI